MDEKLGKSIKTLNAVRKEMKTSLVERGTAIDLVVLSTIARTHMVMLGPPGVAKSMLVREFMGHIGEATLFEILLSKTTPPEALVGPISLSALERDEFRRVTTGKLPEAHIAFLDEIYKSNATNLNILLAIVNERLFHNDGAPMTVPLWSLFGASNELPTHDRQDLMAFTDRMPVRYVVDAVRTTEGLHDIFTGQIARDKGEVVGGSHTLIPKAEVERLQQEAMQVKVPDRVIARIAELQLKAAGEGLHVSARRMGEGRRIAQANALLNGRTEVKLEDLRTYEWILWDDPEDIPLASELTLDFAGAVGKAVANLRSEYEQYTQKLSEAQGMWPANPDETVSDQASAAMVNVSNNFNKLGQRVARAIEDAENDGHDPAELISIQQDVERAKEVPRGALLGTIDK